VEIIAQSFDDLDRLCDCVSREWTMFAPPVLRLRTRPRRLNGPNMVLDESLYVARYRDMRPPATHVWLEPFDQVEDAEAMVNTRYQQLAADDPATISSGTRSSDRIRMGSCSQRWSPPLNG
jgi:hypothetical protein